MLTAESRLRDFPSLTGMTYLNTAAEGIPPLAVRAGLEQYFRDKQLGMDGRILHKQAFAETQALVADLYGLTASEIGICSCSSEAFNLASMALQLRDTDEVIINDLDYPSGASPWLLSTCPATVRVWKSREGALRLEDLAGLLTPKTRLVAVSLVSFFNGFRLSIPQVAEIVQRHSSALLSVDVTQALGRIPLVLTGADLIVSSTHKWILASHGGGLVGVPQAREQTWHVPAGGWYNLKDPFGPNRFEEVVTLPGAAGFSVGMPNFPAIYMVRAALSYLQEVGISAIDAAAKPLVEHCLEGIAKLPVELLTPRDNSAIAGIIGFRHPSAESLSKQLRDNQIHIMSHAGRLRIAIHGYNTHQDIETFLRTLSTILKG